MTTIGENRAAYAAAHAATDPRPSRFADEGKPYTAWAARADAWALANGLPQPRERKMRVASLPHGRMVRVSADTWMTR